MTDRDPSLFEDDDPEEDDDLAEYIDGLLIYIFLWYRSLHAGDQVYADIPGFGLCDQDPDVCKRNLVNATSGQVWEAKTGMSGLVGIDGGVAFGTDWPELDTLISVSRQLAEYIQTLNSQLSGKSQTGTWEVGSLARDPALAAFFDTWPYCTGRGPSSVCSIRFTDGSCINIMRPTEDGVLLYSMSQVGPVVPILLI